MNISKILVAGGLFGLGTAWGSYIPRAIPPCVAISLAMIILAFLWSDLYPTEKENDEAL